MALLVALRPPAQAWLPPDKQEEVNWAIDRGVEYLKRSEKPTGTWSVQGNYQVGLAGLPAIAALANICLPPEVTSEVG